MIVHRDIESRQRVERMMSRLELKVSREDEEDKFQEKIKSRLQEWN